MFFGFKSLSLFQGNFLYFNGLRIVMKPPSHPSKLGVYIEVNVKEYEHYTVSNVFKNDDRGTSWTIRTRTSQATNPTSSPYL